MNEETLTKVLIAVDKLRVAADADVDEQFNTSFAQIGRTSGNCQATASKYVEGLVQRGYLILEKKPYGINILLTKEGHDFLLASARARKMMKNNLQTQGQNAPIRYTVKSGMGKCGSGSVFELPTADFYSKLSVKESARIARRNGYMTVRERMTKK